MADFFFKIAHQNGAINYCDSAIGNDILSVHYQMGGGFCKNLGSALIPLQIKQLYVGQFQYER